MVKYLYDGTDVLDDQSQAKHRIISEYLRQYYLTYFTNQKIPKLRLAIVDGFSGGGVFSNGLGSPILTLKVTKEAEEEISIQRGREVEIDAKFFFIDTDENATKALFNNIEEHNLQHSNFSISTSEFGAKLPDIISGIKTHVPRNERCIFILDPYDYKSISLNHIREISRLKNSEIIWLVTTDHISHYLSENSDAFEKVFTQRLGASLQDTIALKTELLLAKEKTDWPLCRHIICKFLAERSGFPEACDFPIRQVGSNKDYTILHLSKHEKARDVMLVGHWHRSNDTQVISHNGIKYFNPSHIYKNNDMLFSFTDTDQISMIENAANELLQRLPEKEDVQIEDWRKSHSKQFSAMTKADFNKALELVRDGVDFLTKKNKDTKSLASTVAVRKKRQFSFWKK